jgi:hypothetical protein
MAVFGGFYTEEEIRDIVSFAASRRIVIFPAIPARFFSYPGLGCTGGGLPSTGTVLTCRDCFNTGDRKKSRLVVYCR